MGRFTRTLGPMALLVGSVALWGFSAASLPAAEPPTAERASAAPVAWPAGGAVPGAQSQAMGYVGQDMCLECHEDRGEPMLASRHGMERDFRTPAAKLGCESCHGPGEAHVEGNGDPELIMRFSSMDAADASEACTTCHNRGEHAFWDTGPHSGRDVGCTTCHGMHDWKSERAQLKQGSITDAWAQCHADKAAKMKRVNHMPVPEGRMDCTSCHNPHGSANVRLLRVGFSINESCLSCHAEKRGPFLWEHAAVQESCTSCHDPHGSNYDRLLVTKPPTLCQRCHNHTRHPARPYDSTNLPTATQSYYRACVNCHQNLHGSNHPSGRFFLR